MPNLYETLDFLENNYESILVGFMIIGGLGIAYVLHQSAKRHERQARIIKESGLEKIARK